MDGLLSSFLCLDYYGILGLMSNDKIMNFSLYF